MKKRALSFLLILTAILGIALPGVTAAAAEAPKLPLFLMRAEADAPGELQEGEQLCVHIYGEPLHLDRENMVSFQIDLQYPADRLELLRIEAEGPFANVGSFETNQASGQAVFNAMTRDGLALEKGGTLLATAVFTVLPLTEDCSVAVGLRYAEITRPQDKDGQPVSLQQSDPVKLHYVPTLALPEACSPADETVTVTLHNNPAGTLFAAVYGENGQLLRCAGKSGVPAQAQPQTLGLSMAGGSLVKVFLLDSRTSAPLCPPAKMNVQ